VLYFVSNLLLLHITIIDIDMQYILLRLQQEVLIQNNFLMNNHKWESSSANAENQRYLQITNNNSDRKQFSFSNSNNSSQSIVDMFLSP
jgi:hypothetical protein